VVKGLLDSLFQSNVYEFVRQTAQHARLFDVLAETLRDEPLLAHRFWESDVRQEVLVPLLTRAVQSFPLDLGPLLTLMESLASDAFCAGRVFVFMCNLHTFTGTVKKHAPPAAQLQQLDAHTVVVRQDWVSSDGLFLPKGTRGNVTRVSSEVTSTGQSAPPTPSFGAGQRSVSQSQLRSADPNGANANPPSSSEPEYVTWHVTWNAWPWLLIQLMDALRRASSESLSVQAWRDVSSTVNLIYCTVSEHTELYARLQQELALHVQRLQRAGPRAVPALAATSGLQLDVTSLLLRYLQYLALASQHHTMIAQNGADTGMRVP